ncbi:MAG: cyclic nucleotide-binding domain-containing protein, partial [Elusimicrobia bacterium]|nr:cyclic nucleotide-binding domain-containing protein [Elusimicrobiota bacterium]
MIDSSELRKLRLFRDASANALARLATAMRERICAPGEIVLKEGEENVGLHLVASGIVSVRKRIDHDSVKTVARLGEGEFFGEMSLLEKRPASAEVAADGTVRLFVLTRSDFEFLMSKAPSEAVDHLMTLMTGLSTRLRQTTRELVTVYQVARNVGRFDSVEELSAHILQILAAALGAHVTVGFYRWNLFNEEYGRLGAVGPDSAMLPETLDRTI